MSRNALARLFERLVVASLPLVVPACKSNAHSNPAADLSTATGGNADDDMMVDGDPGDMATAPPIAPADLYGLDLNGVDLSPDVCETTTDPPPTIVPFPASDL